MSRAGCFFISKKQHGARQREYVYWKQKMLFPHVGKVTESQVVDKRTDKTYYKTRFNTLTRAHFNKYHDLFYKDRVKCVPANIEQLLVSDLALAVWYLDDGSLRTDCKAFRLHTNNYPLDSVVLLQRALLSNYGITSRIQKQDASKKKEERGFLLAIHFVLQNVQAAIMGRQKDFLQSLNPL